MAIFLTDEERRLIEEHRTREPLNRFYWTLIRRTHERAASPGIIDFSTSVHWWHSAAEYLTDAAMSYALKPVDDLGRWVRDVTLSVVRRSQEDWVGPAFRDHTLEPRSGHLETAHLCLGVASALDLAPDVFTDGERREIEAKLREEGMPLCVHWLDRVGRLNNWSCVLTFGVAAPAAVLNDTEMMQRAVEGFKLCVQAYQPDGSYAESLQYSNYASTALMLVYEALTRRDPALKAVISPVPYAKSVRWSAYSFFYNKPLTGWGQYPMPRSANFNDSAAIHRPTADLLLHVAARVQDGLPLESGLARWLFDTLYLPYPNQTPFDLMSFGFFNHFGWLTLPLLPQACEPVSPDEASLPVVAHFSSGDVLARDSWQGRTVLAARSGGDPLYGPGHLHGDLNSFILVHNRERLLLDPGHACYRNLIRELDIATQTHNACTFSVGGTGGPERQEDVLVAKTLQQRTSFARSIVDGKPGAPVDRGARHLLAAQAGPVKVVGAEAAKLYGPPIETYMRFWFLLGEHALFVVDHILSSQPVKTTWNWLLNNRDGTLDLKLVRPDRLVARRGDAGLKLFHLGGGTMQGPVYAHVHDAYHPLPNQLGEGRPGSGMLVRWQEREARTERTVVHAIPVDYYGAVAGWHLRQADDQVGLEGPGGVPLWQLEVQTEPLAFVIKEVGTGLNYRVSQSDSDEWKIDEE